ncbi:divalent-cation tolerance protein CutA [Leptospira ognonensis]|uniref:Divalent-cation tolerance protein CutA n=1 Tax=Leptospira ognonensis TaxID=2484945 RepID=A0A4R9JXB6_9LEPT|nr:divalent-cation tolerance protein CutA [Leptospira ognonensis]TGL57112.1 divalent-cation tolerance protein CutA [Leptospira ognonensis]
MEQIQFIYITVKDTIEAERIARALVEERLVACANILPAVTSIYIWKNELQSDSEVLLFLKTKESLVDRAISRAKELHSYEVPCIVSYEAKNGNPDYLEWIRNSL